MIKAAQEGREQALGAAREAVRETGRINRKIWPPADMTTAVS